MSRRAWITASVIAVGLAVLFYYFELGGSGQISALQLKAHAESTLMYPNSYNALSVQVGEDDRPGWPLFNNQDPRPAVAEMQFYTVSKVGDVIAWYAQSLSGRGWRPGTARSRGPRVWMLSSKGT